jgi:hypothetical protein
LVLLRSDFQLLGLLLPLNEVVLVVEGSLLGLEEEELLHLLLQEHVIVYLRVFHQHSDRFFDTMQVVIIIVCTFLLLVDPAFDVAEELRVLLEDLVV